MTDTPNVLVVEDERETRAFIVATLREVGVLPTGVGNLCDARAALRERSFTHCSLTTNAHSPTRPPEEA